MAKPRTIEQIQRDQIRKTTELLKIEYRLMWKVRLPRIPTWMRDGTRQSSNPRTLPARDRFLR